jgi:osmotically-inducible protein OsmY
MPPRSGSAWIRGAVSLLGSVDTYAEKWAAEDATKRVSGVRAVAQDLTVKILTDHERADSDIAAAVQNALVWDVFVPKGVNAQVRRGAVTLEGRWTGTISATLRSEPCAI